MQVMKVQVSASTILRGLVLLMLLQLKSSNADKPQAVGETLKQGLSEFSIPVSIPQDARCSPTGPESCTFMAFSKLSAGLASNPPLKTGAVIFDSSCNEVGSGDAARGTEITSELPCVLILDEFFPSSGHGPIQVKFRYGATVVDDSKTQCAAFESTDGPGTWKVVRCAFECRPDECG